MVTACVASPRVFRCSTRRLEHSVALHSHKRCRTSAAEQVQNLQATAAIGLCRAPGPLGRRISNAVGIPLLTVDAVGELGLRIPVWRANTEFVAVLDAVRAGGRGLLLVLLRAVRLGRVDESASKSKSSSLLFES